MNTDEILEGLTPAQRKELDDQLQAVALAATADFNKNPEKFGRLTQKISLQANISLVVTIDLYRGDKDKVCPVIEEIVL